MITDLWRYFAGFGFIAAPFFKLRGIAILAGALFVGTFAGLVITGLAGSDTWPWIFGIALMASPIIGAIAMAGVLFGWLVKLVIRKATSEPTESSDDADWQFTQGRKHPPQTRNGNRSRCQACVIAANLAHPGAVPSGHSLGGRAA